MTLNLTHFTTHTHMQIHLAGAIVDHFDFLPRCLLLISFNTTSELGSSDAVIILSSNGLSRVAHKQTGQCKFYTSIKAIKPFCFKNES